MSAARQLGKSQACQVKGNKFGIALSWDSGSSSAVDLDLQGVAFSSTGKLMDAVYYNNLKALGRGLTHSGDETTGQKRGFDECIWVNNVHLPAEVQLVVFVVAAYKGGNIRDAKNATFHLLEDVLAHEVGRFALEHRAERAAIIGSLIRGNGGGWTFFTLDLPARQGQHFIDILEPTIGDYVRTIIPGAPKKIKAAFAMEKGSVADLPQTAELHTAHAGLGWDTAMGEVDLDVSAVLLDKSANEIDCCFFGNEECQGIKHSGDNLTGQGSGDDEVITINLEGLAPEVEQIFFVINIYSKQRTFSMVANPYCRIVTALGEEFCRYQLEEAGHEEALIMARLFREPGDFRFGFQAVGVPCKGRTYKDSMPAVVQYARKRPQELAFLRGSSATSLEEDYDSASATAHPLVEAAGIDTGGICAGKCCVQ